MRLGIQGATAAANARVSVPRAILVTFGLGGVGAAGGAGLGAGLAAAVNFAIHGPGYPYILEASPLAGFIGGMIGAIAFPFTVWSLPRVGVGRIIAATSLGTALGGTSFFFWADWDPFAAILGAIIGFAFGATCLGIRSSTLWDDAH